MPRTLLLSFALVLLGARAAAHEFWIRPTDYAPAKDARVGLELCVGMNLAGDKLPRNEAKLERFFALDPDGHALDVVGLDGRAPAGWLRPDRAGTWWVGYQSKPTAIELEAAKFESYLRDEGLDAVLAERSRLGESASPGREQYSRSVKALLVCAGGPTRGWERELGLPLELVLRNDPSTLARGGRLELELHFQGKPLVGALVGCRREGAGSEPRLRTDEHGRVGFALEEPGMHLVRVVHMLAAEPASGSRWRSYWSSLSFSFSPASAPAK